MAAEIFQRPLVSGVGHTAARLSPNREGRGTRFGERVGMNIRTHAAMHGKSDASFTLERFTPAHDKPMTLRPAQFRIGNGDPVYIGGGVAIEASPATELSWGVHLAGSNLDDAVAAARKLSAMQFRPYGNSADAATAVAILQRQNGGYVISTIWTTDFHSDHSSPVTIKQLQALSTKRRNLVAIVDQTGWLRRDRIDPVAFGPTPWNSARV